MEWQRAVNSPRKQLQVRVLPIQPLTAGVILQWSTPAVQHDAYDGRLSFRSDPAHKYPMIDFKQLTETIELSKVHLPNRTGYYKTYQFAVDDVGFFVAFRQVPHPLIWDKLPQFFDGSIQIDGSNFIDITFARRYTKQVTTDHQPVNQFAVFGKVASYVSAYLEKNPKVRYIGMMATYQNLNALEAVAKKFNGKLVRKFHSRLSNQTYLIYRIKPIHIK